MCHDGVKDNAPACRNWYGSWKTSYCGKSHDGSYTSSHTLKTNLRRSDMIHQLQIIFEYIDLWAPRNCWLKIAGKTKKNDSCWLNHLSETRTCRRFTNSVAMPVVASIKTCVQSLFSMPLKVLGVLEMWPFFSDVPQVFLGVYILFILYIYMHLWISYDITLRTNIYIYIYWHRIRILEYKEYQLISMFVYSYGEQVQFLVPSILGLLLLHIYIYIYIYTCISNWMECVLCIFIYLYIYI